MHEIHLLKIVIYISDREHKYTYLQENGKLYKWQPAIRTLKPNIFQTRITLFRHLNQTKLDLSNLSVLHVYDKELV